MMLLDINNLDKSNAVILGVVGVIILIIVIAAFAKSKGAGCLILIIAAIIAYLLISAEVFRI